MKIRCFVSKYISVKLMFPRMFEGPWTVGGTSKQSTNIFSVESIFPPTRKVFFLERFPLCRILMMIVWNVRVKDNLGPCSEYCP